MRLYYIANVRMPTEKAHGVAIAKACEAYANADVQTELILPARRNITKETIFSAYDVKPVFKVRHLWTVDLIGFGPGKFMYWLQTITFLASLLFYFLLKSRQVVIYSRDINSILLFTFLGYRVVFECHHIQKNRQAFFKLMRMTEHIVVISQALKADFIENGFTEDSLLIAPSGVDLSTFEPEISKDDARKKLAISLDARVAVYTGYLYAWKGVDTLAQAALITPGVQVYIVGGTDSDVATFNKKWHRENIHIVGQRPHSEIPMWLKAADVLVLPNILTDEPISRYTSPLKLFEYMAAMRPIVASDLPNIREILSEKNAILVKPDDAQAIASGIAWCLEHDEANALAAQAHKDVERYSWDNRAKGILTFLGSQ